MSKVNRRDFVKTAVTASIAASAVSAASRPVMGANDRINLAVIGVGGRGNALLSQALEISSRTSKTQVVAVSDVYEKRKRVAAERSKAKGYLNYKEILEQPDIDAVIVATPDHWHAAIAIEAMKKGKDVYLEKPFTHTIAEARSVNKTAQETKRVLQVGSQTTSSDQWWKARKAIQDGLIGKLIMSQGSYHRNSIDGEWNWRIDPDAGPDGKGDNYIDWKAWLGPAPERPYNADRFFRFRKYWDYSGGIATDLFYHVVAPLQICWGQPQFPLRVTASGGRYIFKDEREVPDTFHLMAEFPAEHSLVLSSSMANEQHIPGLIRGHEGTIMIVPEGQFEGRVDNITVTPSRIVRKQFYEKHGTEVMRIPTEERPMTYHMENWLQAIRSREKPMLDSNTAYHAQVVISMAVQAYRSGKVLYWDPRTETVVESMPDLALKG
ncbi:MAG TPA: Gfo/Idh/MocA family oxidoreductase [Acidobacteriota bacterium]|jgi:predicted dehydrogenase|nr:Gfo/Idh/MocA family oxidoreductase [Acidobacteriota bacterium]